MSEPRPAILSLNDVADLITNLRSGDLRAAVLGSAVASLRPDCDARCGCNTRDCNCNGNVSKKILDDISFPEFQRMRQQRMTELREQLARLESET
jgi:hypothetical protein